MDIINRIADVKKIRCNVCQDFIAMILKPGWREDLYKLAEKQVETGSFLGDYSPCYERMREVGVENYSIEDMDVSLITGLVSIHRDFIKDIKRATIEAIRLLRDDRNTDGHSGENKEPETLYLEAIISLQNIKKFIQTVDLQEKWIEDSIRSSFLQKYAAKVEDLKTIIDKERINIIQRQEDIDHDIRKILNSEDQHDTWYRLEEKYFALYYMDDKQRFFDFVIGCYEAGISYAYYHAFLGYCFRKEYQRAEEILIERTNSYDNITLYAAKETIGCINDILRHDKSRIESLSVIIEKIKSQGISIEQDVDGFYRLGK